MAVVTVPLSPTYRAHALERLRTETFDVLVIGGGATGCGAALDAASRGLSVALVEQRDIAAGTSSRSSKLVHGGLRYLEQLHFGLVREALRERELLLSTLAPHVVHPVSFLLPLRHHTWERTYMGAGVALYDLLGGAKSVPRHRHLSKKAVLEMAPGLQHEAFVGGILYHDSQMDDARLAVSIALTAADCGAVVTTGTRVTGLAREGQRVVGAMIRDEESGQTIDVRARCVVSCTGVWTDSVSSLLGGADANQLQVRASKGVHIVVPRSAFPADTGLLLRTERSVLFVIPMGEHWLIGTTDTPYDEDLDEPVATAADISYILDHVNAVLQRVLTIEDVVGVFAGLRPLVDTSAGTTDTTKVSREHIVSTIVPGLVSIAGGKWTTYRVMAEDVIDAVVGHLGAAPGPSRTAELPLTGAVGLADTQTHISRLASQTAIPSATVHSLVNRYGSAARDVLDLAAQRPELAAPLPDVPEHIAAEVVYACSVEGARRLEDVLERRMRCSMVHRGALEAAETVAVLMAAELGWSEQRKQREISDYRALVEEQLAGMASLGVQAPEAVSAH